MEGELQRLPEAGADVRVITSGGRSIPAHCHILASASPVLESLLCRPTQRRWSPDGDHHQKTVLIPGVPCEAVESFLRFLYSPARRRRLTSELKEGYSMHMLVLSHAYRVRWLKQAAETALADQLTTDAVVDVLQLARQCDTPRLYLRCMRWIAENFNDVATTEAWRFVQVHDPQLELEILQFVGDADQRLRRRRRQRWEQGLYLQLSEAMECLQHICTEGCTDVGPYDKGPPNKRKSPCRSFQTCSNLQLLIRHFTVCEHKQGCTSCKRMWQLLRLHSSICDQLDPCKIPLCGHFRLRSQQMQDGKGYHKRWMVLANKVAPVKVMSALLKRKRQEHNQRAMVGNRAVK